MSSDKFSISKYAAIIAAEHNFNYHRADNRHILSPPPVTSRMPYVADWFIQDKIVFLKYFDIGMFFHSSECGYDCAPVLFP